MKNMISKQRATILLIIMPILALSACGSGVNAETQANAETQVVDVTAVSPPVSPTPGAISVVGDPVFGPGEFFLPDTQAGLADLTSYQATLIMSFEGTRDGQPSQWSKTYVMSSVKQPIQSQLTLEETGDLSEPDAVFMADVNGVAYEHRGANTCNANLIEEGNSLTEQWEPAGFLNGVLGAEKAGAETVNGVASDKYTFDERALGHSDTAKSTGEMWIASEAGYVVKYVLTTEGDANYFGEGMAGSLTWDYELTDMNQPITFALPDDCPAGMVDAPLLPDASNMLNVPSVLVYDTASSLAEAVAFYQEQIPGLGWTLVGEPAITETTAMMEFTQENRAMTVIITADDVGTKVQIVLEKAQE